MRTGGCNFAPFFKIKGHSTGVPTHFVPDCLSVIFMIIEKGDPLHGQKPYLMPKNNYSYQIGTPQNTFLVWGVIMTSYDVIQG